MRWYRDHANGWTLRIEDDTADRWLVYAYARGQGEASRATQLDVHGERDVKDLVDGLVQPDAPHFSGGCSALRRE